jgi:hypothetical protein
MKFVVGSVPVILIALLLGAAGAQTEERREAITVKSAAENNGVVIVTGHGEKAPIELQCNQGFSGCTPLKPGEYVMVRLPKNRGPYECSNVTVYAKSADPTVSGDELGRYCIGEK